jgi:hypothetical protein
MAAKVSWCSPGASSTHLGIWSDKVIMPSRVSPSRIDTNGAFDDTLRTGVRMIPCISKPVRCRSLTWRSRRRSSHDIWSWLTGSTVYGAFGTTSSCLRRVAAATDEEAPRSARFRCQTRCPRAGGQRDGILAVTANWPPP